VEVRLRCVVTRWVVVRDLDLTRCCDRRVVRGGCLRVPVLQEAVVAGKCSTLCI
jgi:hypothetical protein